MAEAADELSAPLGRETARGKRRFRLPFTAKQVLAGLLGLFLATFAGYALFHDDPFGGEPGERRDETPETLRARLWVGPGRPRG